MQIVSYSKRRWFGQIADLTTIFYSRIFAILQVLRDSRFVLHMSGKLRRFGLVHFQKRYVQSQLLARKGDCRQCGTCCNLLFTCPMLTKKGRCLAYGTCRPRACRVFPIDQRDIDEVNLCGGHCGYHFNQEGANRFLISEKH